MPTGVHFTGRASDSILLGYFDFAHADPVPRRSWHYSALRLHARRIPTAGNGQETASDRNLTTPPIQRWTLHRRPYFQRTKRARSGILREARVGSARTLF